MTFMIEYDYRCLAFIIMITAVTLAIEYLFGGVAMVNIGVEQSNDIRCSIGVVVITSA